MTGLEAAFFVAQSKTIFFVKLFNFFEVGRGTFIQNRGLYRFNKFAKKGLIVKHAALNLAIFEDSL